MRKLKIHFIKIDYGFPVCGIQSVMKTISPNFTECGRCKRTRVFRDEVQKQRKITCRKRSK